MFIDVLFDLLGVLPNHLFHAYMCCRMLTMRNTPLFCALYFAFVALSVFKASMSFVVQLFLFFGMLLVLPLAMSKGSLAHRLMATLLLLAAVLLADSIFVPLWYFVTGYPVSDHYTVTSDPLGYAFARMVSYPLLFAMLVVARVVYDRVVAAKSDDDLMLFVGFVLTQISLLFALAYVFEQVPGYAEAAMSVGVAYAAVSLAADAYLMVSLDRSSKARREQQHAAELEERLAVSLRRYEQVAREVEHAAKVRHEVRGQVQAIGYLADSGETERACQLADEMIAEIEQGARDGGRRASACAGGAARDAEAPERSGDNAEGAR